jgi:uncharacterized iron-regulated membrane protein
MGGAASTSQPRRRAWPDYGTIWRWHFYAGLLCVPFVLFLAVTGSIYVWRPQIEAWLDRPYAHVTQADAPRAGDAAIAGAAVRAVPGAVLHRFQLPDTATQAVQVIVGEGTRERRLYIHPQTLQVLKAQDEDGRPMRVVFRLHGELLAGDWGSYIVELAASWAIVMIVSGLVLWWPRGRGLAGTVWPRLSLRGRPLWRDLHASVGLWVSLFALIFLLSGLPWAKSWGSYLRAARSMSASMMASQDWTVSHTEELAIRATHDRGTRMMMGEHAEHGGMAMAHPRGDYAALDKVVPAVAALSLPAPVLVAPPTGIGQPWTAKSDTADRPHRVDLTLGPDGTVRSRTEFAERPFLDRLVGTGVAAHEGQWFGLANQLLNLLIAIGLVLLSVSGVMMWWKRKPADVLGAPPARNGAAPAIGFFALLVAFGIYLPLLGLSLIVVLMIERLVLRRLPGTRRWLGLRPA